MLTAKALNILWHGSNSDGLINTFAISFKVHGSLFLLFYLKCCLKILSIHAQWRIESGIQITRVLNSRQSKHIQRVVLFDSIFLFNATFFSQWHIYYCGKSLTLWILQPLRWKTKSKNPWMRAVHISSSFCLSHQHLCEFHNATNTNLWRVALD